jgi:hypothetical protein
VVILRWMERSLVDYWTVEMACADPEMPDLETHDTIEGCWRREIAMYVCEYCLRFLVHGKL